MGDFFQQFKKQEQINEGLFSKLFSKGGKAQDTQDVYEDNNGIYHFGENSTAGRISVDRGSVPDVLNFDFKSSDGLRFLVEKETNFNAKQITLSLDEQKVIFFNGNWNSGKFIGGRFNGEFRGHLFIGNFMGSYLNYKSNPLTFESGTFEDITNKGILGIPNTITVDGLNDNESFNLITVPVGYSIQMRSANGIDSSIKVLKRLDKDSSDFKFEVTDGFNDTTLIKDLSWQDIKMSFKNFNIQKNGSVNIGNLIVAPKGDYIKELYISKSKSTFTTPQSKTSAQANASPQVYKQGQKYTFNLSEIPLLNITSIRGEKGKFAGSTSPNVSLSFDTPEEFAQFNNIVTNIKNGSFANDLKVIAKGIKYGTIDGYGPYDYLKNIFNSKGAILKEAKKTTKPIASVVPPSSNVPSVKESMERLNSFVYYFVENIVTKNGVPNEAAKKTILDKIKSSLGIQPAQPIAPQNQQAQQVSPKGPGMTPADTTSAFTVKESIRGSVRNIINDSF
jgi:hypothetical protein